jgi:predicted DNA-binding transcriptional regulator AlpA
VSSPAPDLNHALRDIVREVVREELCAAIAEVTSGRAGAWIGAEANHAVNQNAGASDELLDDRELAAWLKVSRETCQQWRTRGEGPPYVKIAARAVRYQRNQVETWLVKRRRG